MTPVALVALACYAPAPMPAPALDGVVVVLRGEAVPAPPTRADVAAALAAVAPIRRGPRR